MIEVVIFQWLLICHILQRGWVIEVCFLCYATFEFTLSHPSIQVWCLTSILEWGSLCRCIIWEFHIPIISRAGGRPRMPQQLTPTKKWWPKAFSHSVVLHPDSRCNPPKIKLCTRAWDAQKATNPFSNCRMMYIIGLTVGVQKLVVWLLRKRRRRSPLLVVLGMKSSMEKLSSPQLQLSDFTLDLMRHEKNQI